MKFPKLIGSKFSRRHVLNSTDAGTHLLSESIAAESATAAFSDLPKVPVR
jgi:hypothetical protein